jgi:hypothetical protein
MDFNKLDAYASEKVYKKKEKIKFNEAPIICGMKICWMGGRNMYLGDFVAWI